MTNYLPGSGGGRGFGQERSEEPARFRAEHSVRNGTLAWATQGMAGSSFKAPDLTVRAYMKGLLCYIQISVQLGVAV